MEIDDETIEGVSNEPSPSSGIGIEQGSANVHGDFLTPLDQIRGNAVAEPQGDIEESDEGDNAEPDIGGDDSEAEEVTDDFGTEIETAADETLKRLFNPRGKHPFLTDQIIADFCQNLRTCIFQELAAIEAGISVNSLKNWMAQGRVVHEYLWDAIGTYDSETQYGKEKLTEIVNGLNDVDWMVYKLYQEAMKAKAYGERDDLDFIARARSKDWKAAAYRLKIRNRQIYADTQAQTNVNVNTGDVTQSLTVVDFGQWMKDDDGQSLEIDAEEVEEIDPNDDRTTD